MARTDATHKKNVAMKAQFFEHGWAMLPRFILRMREISPNAKLVLMYMIDKVWNSGRIFPGHGTVAANLGISLRSVARSLEELHTVGLLDWKQRGLGFTNEYTLNPIPPWVLEKYGDSVWIEHSPLIEQAENPCIAKPASLSCQVDKTGLANLANKVTEEEVTEEQVSAGGVFAPQKPGDKQTDDNSPTETAATENGPPSPSTPHPPPSRPVTVSRVVDDGSLPQGWDAARQGGRGKMRQDAPRRTRRSGATIGTPPSRLFGWLAKCVRESEHFGGVDIGTPTGKDLALAKRLIEEQGEDQARAMAECLVLDWSAAKAKWNLNGGAPTVGLLWSFRVDLATAVKTEEGLETGIHRCSAWAKQHRERTGKAEAPGW
jgi:hypothetical protein